MTMVTRSSESGDYQPATVGLLGVVRILFRWSFVVAPLAALTVWIAISQSAGIEPEYRAEAALVLVGPNELIVEDFETGETTIEQVNPLQNLGGTLATVARVTVLGMSDPSVATELADEGLAWNYVVYVDGRSPIVRIEVFDSDPDLANRTLERVTTMVIDDLGDLQDALDAPESNRIGAKLISSGLIGGPDYGARTRFRLAIAAVGFALSAASAFFLEGLAELWRRRRRPRPVQLALPSSEQTSREFPQKFRSAQAMVEAEWPTMVGVAHLLSGDPDLSESIAAEAVEAAEDQWTVIRKNEPVAWLYGEVVAAASAQPVVAATEEHDSLWVTVQTMPPDTQAVLALSSIARLPDDRIAVALSIDIEQVEQHRSDASRILDDAGTANEPPVQRGSSSTRDKPASGATKRKTSSKNPGSSEGTPQRPRNSKSKSSSTKGGGTQGPRSNSKRPQTTKSGKGQPSTRSKR